MAGQFGAKLKQGGKHTMERIDTIRRKATIALFDSVVLSTPVDTGRLRGNWQCSLNSPKEAELAERSVGEVFGEIRDNLGTMQDTVWLSNNLPYVEKIEYEGHSGQAPEGMVRVNCANWNQIVINCAKGTRL